MGRGNGRPDMNNAPPWVLRRWTVCLNLEGPSKANFPTCRHKNEKVKITLINRGARIHSRATRPVKMTGPSPPCWPPFPGGAAFNHAHQAPAPAWTRGPSGPPLAGEPWTSRFISQSLFFRKRPATKVAAGSISEGCRGDRQTDRWDVRNRAGHTVRSQQMEAIFNSQPKSPARLPDLARRINLLLTAH